MWISIFNAGQWSILPWPTCSQIWNEKSGLPVCRSLNRKRLARMPPGIRSGWTCRPNSMRRLRQIAEREHISISGLVTYYLYRGVHGLRDWQRGTLPLQTDLPLRPVRVRSRLHQTGEVVSIRYRSTEAYRLLPVNSIRYPITVAYTVAHPSPGSPTRRFQLDMGTLFIQVD